MAQLPAHPMYCPPFKATPDTDFSACVSKYVERFDEAQRGTVVAAAEKLTTLRRESMRVFRDVDGQRSVLLVTEEDEKLVKEYLARLVLFQDYVPQEHLPVFRWRDVCVDGGEVNEEQSVRFETANMLFCYAVLRARTAMAHRSAGKYADACKTFLNASSWFKKLEDDYATEQYFDFKRMNLTAVTQIVFAQALHCFYLHAEKGKVTLAKNAAVAYRRAAETAEVLPEKFVKTLLGLAKFYSLWMERQYYLLQATEVKDKADNVEHTMGAIGAAIKALATQQARGTISIPPHLPKEAVDRMSVLSKELFASEASLLQFLQQQNRSIYNAPPAEFAPMPQELVTKLAPNPSTCLLPPITEEENTMKALPQIGMLDACERFKGEVKRWGDAETNALALALVTYEQKRSDVDPMQYLAMRQTRSTEGHVQLPASLKKSIAEAVASVDGSKPSAWLKASLEGHKVIYDMSMEELERMECMLRDASLEDEQHYTQHGQRWLMRAAGDMMPKFGQNAETLKMERTIKDYKERVALARVADDEKRARVAEMEGETMALLDRTVEEHESHLREHTGEVQEAMRHAVLEEKLAPLEAAVEAYDAKLSAAKAAAEAFNAKVAQQFENVFEQYRSAGAEAGDIDTFLAAMLEELKSSALSESVEADLAEPLAQLNAAAAEVKKVVDANSAAKAESAAGPSAEDKVGAYLRSVDRAVQQFRILQSQLSEGNHFYQQTMHWTTDLKGKVTSYTHAWRVQSEERHHYLSLSNQSVADQQYAQAMHAQMQGEATQAHNARAAQEAQDHQYATQLRSTAPQHTDPNSPPPLIPQTPPPAQPWTAGNPYM